MNVHGWRTYIGRYDANDEDIRVAEVLAVDIQPYVQGVLTLIHKTKDGRIFVGAASVGEELAFPPKFFPSLEAALVWIQLVKD